MLKTLNFYSVKMQAHDVGSSVNAFKSALQSTKSVVNQLRRVVHEGCPQMLQVWTHNKKHVENERLVEEIVEKGKTLQTNETECKKLESSLKMMSHKMINKEIDQLLYSKETLQEEIDTHKVNESHQKDIPSKQTKEELNSLLNAYEKVLNMSIGIDKSKEGNRLTISFRGICANNPNRKCSVHLKLQSNVFTVTSCKPKIDGIENQVTVLNVNQDVFAFILETRKKFKNLYKT